MSSPFGCNQKNLFGSKAKSKDAKTPEPVTLTVDPSQVVTASIPYGTPMAAPIRQHMHASVTHDGQRIFIFRQVNGWTNISLDSTDTSPKLTCDPITVLNIAYREFNACASVSKVILKMTGDNAEYGYDDIAGMEAKLVPLPEAQETEGAAGGSKTDAEVLYDLAIENQNKMVQLGTDVDEIKTKLLYVVQTVDTTYNKLLTLVQAVDQVYKKVSEEDDGITEPATIHKKARAARK